MCGSGVGVIRRKDLLILQQMLICKADLSPNGSPLLLKVLEFDLSKIYESNYRFVGPVIKADLD